MQGVDFTLLASRDGVVKFQEKRKIRFDGKIFRDTYVSVV
jgi:ribosomal protein L27